MRALGVQVLHEVIGVDHLLAWCGESGVLINVGVDALVSEWIGEAGRAGMPADATS